jgi:hypothetical protein
LATAGEFVAQGIEDIAVKDVAHVPSPSGLYTHVRDGSTKATRRLRKH